ncbi:MAG TPA: hypothetical protein DD381_04890 [Lentisphaeria bacterium]|nr:MAG: hypothetical protein A2X47_01800 [Lentisphaerae bacterium GWF2_38_69]HBM15666.1 hypothetical protein [Lentisphaeria bacterium]
MEYIYTLILTYKYWILLPIAIIEGPIISVIGGFLCAHNILNFYIVYLIIVLGDTIGDCFYYWLARIYGTKFVLKAGKYIGVTQKKMDVMGRLLRKHFVKTMLFSKGGQIAPMPAIVFSGISKINFKKFFIVTTLITIVKSFLLVLLGYYFGESYELFAKYLDKYTFFVTIVVVVLILFFVGKRLLMKSKFLGNEKI